METSFISLAFNVRNRSASALTSSAESLLSFFARFAAARSAYALSSTSFASVFDFATSRAIASPSVSLALSASAAADRAVDNCFNSIEFSSRNRAASRFVALSLDFTLDFTIELGRVGDIAARSGDANCR